MKNILRRSKSGTTWIVWGIETGKPDFPRFEGTQTECETYLREGTTRYGWEWLPSFVESPNGELTLISRHVQD